MRSRGQHKSRLQEKKVAEEVQGIVQKASGASDFAKGDVRKRGFLKVECKTTSKRSFTLKLDDIQKIQSESLTGDVEDWALQVEFQGQMGQNKKVAVIDWYSYLEMRDRK